MKQSQNIVIFISGKGTNAKNLIHFFASHSEIRISLILSDKENEDVRTFCSEKNVAFLFLKKEHFLNPDYLIDITEKHAIDWVVLAGFLKKIPEKFIEKFPQQIFNIHPSLLPKYGGKGMYGNFVHEAILKNKELKSGITIHLVNEEYDKGEILAQFEIDLDNSETIDSLSNKIRKLEHTYFPLVIQKHIENSNQV